MQVSFFFFLFFLFFFFSFLPRSLYTRQRTRVDGVMWVVDRVGARALIRLFCLGVHSLAHYQAYCPSHCYPYPAVSLFCNFPHLTDTTAPPTHPFLFIPFSFPFSTKPPSIPSLSFAPLHRSFPLSHISIFLRRRVSSYVSSSFENCVTCFEISFERAIMRNRRILRDGERLKSGRFSRLTHRR